MEHEIDIQDVLKNMREWAGSLVQENAVLKAQLEKVIKASLEASTTD